MIKGTIRFFGATEEDAALAVEEAARLLREGFTSGKDENELSWFEFDTGDDSIASRG